MKQDNIDNSNKPQSGLEATSIGQLQQAKARNTTFIVFFTMIIFLLLVLFLPDIYKVFSKPDQISGDNNSSSKINLVNNNEEYFLIEKETKIIIDNNQFFDFNIDRENQIINYLAINYNFISTSTFGHDWFVTLYNDAKQLINYQPIEDQVLKYNVENSLSIDLKGIDLNAIKYIKIGVVNESDYPEVNLLSDNQGLQYLLCSKGNSQYYYYFNNNQIYKIKEKFSANTNNDSNLYSILFDTYQAKYTNYLTNQSFKPSFSNYVSNFIFESEVDLSNGNFTNIDENYLAKSTTPKKANFLMGSRGYNCQ